MPELGLDGPAYKAQFGVYTFLFTQLNSEKVGLIYTGLPGGMIQVAAALVSPREGKIKFIPRRLNGSPEGLQAKEENTRGYDCTFTRSQVPCTAVSCFS